MTSKCWSAGCLPAGFLVLDSLPLSGAIVGRCNSGQVARVCSMFCLCKVPTVKPITMVLLSLALCTVPTRAFSQYDGAAALPDQYTAGFNSITVDDSRALLTKLAGDDFLGRGTGQEGFLKAAKWVADNLDSYGFEPAGPNGSWFQNVPFVRIAVNAEHTAIKVGDTQLATGDVFGISQYVGSFHQELPVTLAAVTRERPEITEGQFEGQLLLVRASGSFRSDDPLVINGKPACVVVVVDESRIRTESVSRLEESPVTTPTIQLNQTAAATIARKCGIDGDLVSGDAPADNLIVASTMKVDVQLTVERESIDVPNVVAWYPGADESVNKEYVAIGAHLDHLGVQRDKLFPGADDNASGSAAILQIAKALHESETKPRRSVLFMAFCAEERGLLGSKYYCENPVKPLEDMVCMLNIDMIGRNEETDSEPASENENTIHLIGSKQIAEGLHDTVMEANKYINFVFEYDEERVYQRSDHASFAARGVPVTFLFGGFNPHYHKTTDTLEGINFGKIANAARLNFLTLMMAAENGHFERKSAAEEAAR